MCIRFALPIGNISKIVDMIVKFCKYRLLKKVMRKHVFNLKKRLKFVIKMNNNLLCTIYMNI